MSTYLDFKCAECGATATLLGTDAGVLACDAHRETIAPHAAPLTGWDRDLWSHQLEVIEQTERVEIYRLTDPQDNRGVISSDTRGRGRGWFIGATSGDYLCSKFLVEVWVAEAARAKCRALAEEMAEDRPDEIEDIESLADDIDGVDAADPISVGDWTQRLYDLTGDSEDLQACQGYEPGNAALLCAIQRRFRFLWLARAS